jgi:EAL domain-containing protein (putative c-di-GMP-specific phosphodiesterase class I)
MDLILDRLKRLKAHGIRLAVDDFGTGYSSMSYLSMLPIHTLKIDRAFVQRIGLGAEDSSIVRTMISLAKTLHLEVVSEGVETIEQFECLRDLGCDRGQGYYFARPLTGDQVTAWITGVNMGAFLKTEIPANLPPEPAALSLPAVCPAREGGE